MKTHHKKGECFAEIARKVRIKIQYLLWTPYRNIKEVSVTKCTLPDDVYLRKLEEGTKEKKFLWKKIDG